MKTVDSNFGFKLKKRRNERGLSLDQVAASIGMSKQSVHRFENGTHLPNSSILLKLSEELNVRPTYFFEEDEIEININKLLFREEEIIDKEEVDFYTVKEVCKSYLQNFIELEVMLNVKKDFENPLKGLVIRSTKDIEKAAKQLRRKWKLGNAPISDVIQLIENKGIYIVEVEMNNTFSGFSTYANDSIPLIVLNSNVNDIARKRFTALHELAHLTLEFVDDVKNKIENLCNHFAGAVLLVDDTLESQLGKGRTKISIRELNEIKEKYGISIQAIMVRALVTNLISYETYKKWGDSYSVWSDFEEIGVFISKEEPRAFKKLILRGLNEQRLTWGKAAELMQTKIDVLKSKFQNEYKLVIG